MKNIIKPVGLTLIPRLIRNTRNSLNEDQKHFANRFHVDPSAVSLWEAGKREAGYRVIEFCIKNQMNMLERITNAINPQQMIFEGIDEKVK